MSRFAVRHFSAAILLAAPLIAGTVYAVSTDYDLASSWSTGEESAGAPAVHDDAALVDARRAAGEAGAQAGLLKGGTKQLADGTHKLADGSKQLGAGTTAARDGAAKLADGMNQLQAATGQLGDGATEIANGVDQAVGQLFALEAVRGQILGALDRTIGDIAKSKDPKAAEFKPQLEDFRSQVDTFQVDKNITDQLTKLRDGSRELANQLHVPGYGFHDGIYSATKGSKELSAGLNELAAGVDEALKGVEQLDQGAQKVDGMAKTNQDRVGAVSRALPVIQAGTPEAEEAGITKTLAPMYAFLIAAGVMLAAGTYGRGRAWVVSLVGGIALAALGGSLVAILGAELGAAEAAAAAGICALLVLASGLGTAVLIRAFGATWGYLAALVGIIAQVGIVGWVWNSAATAQIGTTAQALVNLMPLNYPTLALSSLGNGTNSPALWVAVLVTAGLAAAGAVSLKLLGRRESSGAHAAPEDITY
ncbi:hypothetical protein AY498_06235 [Corynebacterium ulcerans]|uniref:hypothetical protein n=1 Tax=Corynebacterium ulcerans TaxID=65058 RepID=UPI000C80F915|nr:hypothetical protein [Corynebacterium ulcerans]MBH5295192.1 hypothetical protein [Corynebacterium ulcerans]MDK8888588.1 hypothetical protein [Corynebacterium ulcerans]PME07156.1 hypothetical protein AY498_06235 [Corynebacterium ulcerans]